MHVLLRTLAAPRGPATGVTETTRTASALSAAGVCRPAAAPAVAIARVGAASGSSVSRGWEGGPSWLAQVATATGWEEGRLAADMLAAEASEPAREDGAEDEGAAAARWLGSAAAAGSVAVARSMRGGVAGATGCLGG